MAVGVAYRADDPELVLEFLAPENPSRGMADDCMKVFIFLDHVTSCLVLGSEEGESRGEAEAIFWS